MFDDLGALTTAQVVKYHKRILNRLIKNLEDYNELSYISVNNKAGSGYGADCFDSKLKTDTAKFIGIRANISREADPSLPEKYFNSARKMLC